MTYDSSASRDNLVWQRMTAFVTGPYIIRVRGQAELEGNRGLDHARSIDSTRWRAWLQRDIERQSATTGEREIHYHR